MKCEKCGSIIDENMIRCPYCGNTINGDFFGYENSVKQQQLKANNPPKKDNSTRIVLIVFGGVMGLFAIIAMLVLLLSGSGSGTQQKKTFDGAFSIKPDFVFCISDNNPGIEYSVRIKNTTDLSEAPTTYVLLSGQKTTFNLSVGKYTMKVKKSSSDMITLDVTVDQNCQYNTAILEYDAKQLQTTNEGDIDISSPIADNTSATQEQHYFAISGLVHSLNDKKIHSYEFEYHSPFEVNICRNAYEQNDISYKSKILYDDKGQLESCYDEYKDYTDYSEFKYDSNGNLIKHSVDNEVTYLKYDSNQRLIERTNSSGGIEQSKYLFEYNDADNKYDSVYLKCDDPNLDREVKFEYDNRGNIVKSTETSCDTNNSEVGRSEIIYDDNNQIIFEYYEETYYEFYSYEENNEYNDGLLTKSKKVFSAEEDSCIYDYTYSYNDDNQIESIVINAINTSDSNENHTSKITCKYDDFGNLIEFNSSRSYATHVENDVIKYEYVEVDKNTSDVLNMYLEYFHKNDDNNSSFSEIGNDFNPIKVGSFISMPGEKECDNYIFN